MSFTRVGIAATAQTQLRPAWSGAQHIDLISSVVTEVFRGTSLSLDDVDFVIDSGSDVLDGRSISNCGFLGAMGAHHKEESRVEEDGLWAALYGATKIAGGSARVGLIIAYSKPSESSLDAFYATQCEPFYQRPVGFDHRVANGIQAQRYIAASSVSTSDLAEIAHQRWTAAARHSNVEIGAIPDVNEILSSPNVASPLTKLMMARPVDGAIAILLAAEDIARRVSRRPVWITGMGAAAERHAFATRAPNVLEGCQAAASSAFKRAGWSGLDADLVETSASSAVTELLVLEALGQSKPGKTLELATNKTKIAVNRSGGALPADPVMATGLVRLSEAANQLVSPESYGLQSPTRAVVHGAGGVGMQSHCVMALEV